MIRLPSPARRNSVAGGAGTARQFRPGAGAVLRRFGIGHQGAKAEHRIQRPIDGLGRRPPPAISRRILNHESRCFRVLPIVGQPFAGFGKQPHPGAAFHAQPHDAARPRRFGQIGDQPRYGDGFIGQAGGAFIQQARPHRIQIEQHDRQHDHRQQVHRKDAGAQRPKAEAAAPLLHGLLGLHRSIPR
jgi:hypothetical protein